LVFSVGSFLLTFPTIFYTYSSSPPFVLHALRKFVTFTKYYYYYYYHHVACSNFVRDGITVNEFVERQS
jgi:hypothetical protein